MQQPWDLETFIAAYNRLADDWSGWYFEAGQDVAELERRYKAYPQHYPTVGTYAEAVFTNEQLVDPCL